MASPNSTYTELFTTTLQHYLRTDAASQITKRNALWAYLDNANRVRKVGGGREIVVPLEYAENATFTRYTGYSLWNLQQSDILTAANFDWKYAVVNVVFSGPEMLQNSGEDQVINLVKTKTRNGLRTLTNNLSQDLYSDGTADGGLQINGLQALVSDAGTGTVGGINSSTYTWWQNTVQSAAAPLQGGGAITPSKSTIRSLINPVRLRVMTYGGTPDLLVMDEIYYGYLEESFQDLQRYVDNAKTAAVGFTTLRYIDMDVIFDGGSGMPASHCYMLDTDSLELVVHRNADMEELDTREPINQHAETHPIIWSGNLVTGNRRVQAVIKA